MSAPPGMKVAIEALDGFFVRAYAEAFLKSRNDPLAIRKSASQNTLFAVGEGFSRPLYLFRSPRVEAVGRFIEAGIR